MSAPESCVCDVRVKLAAPAVASGLLRWLARAYWDAPDEGFLRAFPARAGSCLDGDAVGAFDELASCVADVIAGGHEALMEARIDYTSLFCGCAPDAPYPYESVFSNGERLLMRPSRDEVLKAYEEHEFAPWPADGFEPEDHLAHELAFCAFLIDEQARLAQAGDVEGMACAEETRVRFVNEHLCNWMPLFGESVERESTTGLYGAITRLTLAVVGA